MRRFGSTERFLELLASARALAPEAGARSNVIVGFPGETRADVAELERFLTAARLDAIGVFDYSDEDGTEAAGLPGKVSAATVTRRYDRISALAEELCNQRAEERIGSDGRGAGRDGRRRRGRGPGGAPGARGRRLDHPGRPAGGGVDLTALRPATWCGPGSPRPRASTWSPYRMR